MIKVVGVSRKSGSGVFEDGRLVEWDNMVLHLLNDSDFDVLGCSVSQLKIKYVDFEKLTGIKPDQCSGLVNRFVEFSYLPNGRGQPKLCGIRVLEGE